MKTIITTRWLFVLSTATLACGPAAEAQPHAMSAAEHEAAGRQGRQGWAAHVAQYDPGASAAARCNPSESGSDVCWTSEVNPTELHLREAERQRALAAQHRAASKALRDAEASACADVPAADRDTSPFAQHEDIRSVSPLREKAVVGQATSYRTAGADVMFRAVPGMTTEWLQRVIDCHLARNAAVGHPAASLQMIDCPLTLHGVQARVRSTGNGFAVAIRADDTETSREILRRAESLRSAVQR